MNMLNKKEFVNVIAERAGTTKQQALVIIETFLEGLASVVADGNGLQLSGYLNIKIKDVAEVTRFNPQNRDEKITTPAHKAVKIKAGSHLQELAQ